MADILLFDFQRGRNGVDNPTDPSFPDDQVVEALNVDLERGPIGATRWGSDNIDLTGGTAFASGIRTICRHVPSGDETLAELWGIDGAGLVKRYVNGAWENVQLDDPITGHYSQICGVSFNGKLFLFYQSAVNRLHVWDPQLRRVRRVGIDPGTAVPTVAQTGGSALGGLRYYRVRWLQMNGLICVRRSEPTSASASITPTGAAARVTRPALPGEGETHWELEIAQSTDGPWYIVKGIEEGSSQLDVAISSYNDTTSTASITGLEESDPAGMYALLPSMKFGITDNNRLIGAGSWDTVNEPHESRIWLSPVLGDADRGDDERWHNESDLKGRIDTSEKNGGSITGLLGPVDGVFWSQKYRQVWRHTPTSNINSPYLSKQVSSVVGSISHWGNVLAEDVDGNPVGYFWSHRGPYRIGLNGLIYLGRDIEDIWKGGEDSDYDGINLEASTVVHSTFHSDTNELYSWLATGTGDYPTLRLRLNVKQNTMRDRYGLRGGWRVDTGDAATAYCSCMFANTLGATVSKKLKPYIGRPDTTVYKCDAEDTDTDNGVAFQSYVLTKSIVPAQFMRSLFQVKESVITGVASAGNAIEQVLIGDFKNEKTSMVPLDPKKGEEIVIKKLSGSQQSDCGAIQIRLGDLRALDSHWTLHSLVIPVDKTDDTR